LSGTESGGKETARGMVPGARGGGNGMVPGGMGWARCGACQPVRGRRAPSCSSVRARSWRRQGPPPQGRRGGGIGRSPPLARLVEIEWGRRGRWFPEKRRGGGSCGPQRGAGGRRSTMLCSCNVKPDESEIHSGRANRRMAHLALSPLGVPPLPASRGRALGGSRTAPSRCASAGFRWTPGPVPGEGGSGGTHICTDPTACGHSG